MFLILSKYAISSLVANSITLGAFLTKGFKPSILSSKILKGFLDNLFWLSIDNWFLNGSKYFLSALIHFALVASEQILLILSLKSFISSSLRIDKDNKIASTS